MKNSSIVRNRGRSEKYRPIILTLLRRILNFMVCQQSLDLINDRILWHYLTHVSDTT